MRNGQEQPVRTYRADLGEYVYTKLGKEYYKEKPRKFIVSIPVINVEEKDAEGEGGDPRTWERWFDATRISDEARGLLNEGIEGPNREARGAKIKDFILRTMWKTAQTKKTQTEASAYGCGK